MASCVLLWLSSTLIHHWVWHWSVSMDGWPLAFATWFLMCRFRIATFPASFDSPNRVSLLYPILNAHHWCSFYSKPLTTWPTAAPFIPCPIPHNRLHIPGKSPLRDSPSSSPVSSWPSFPPRGKMKESATLAVPLWSFLLFYPLEWTSIPLLVSFV